MKKKHQCHAKLANSSKVFVVLWRQYTDNLLHVLASMFCFFSLSLWHVRCHLSGRNQSCWTLITWLMMSCCSITRLISPISIWILLYGWIDMLQKPHRKIMRCNFSFCFFFGMWDFWICQISMHYITTSLWHSHYSDTDKYLPSDSLQKQDVILKQGID